MSRDGGSPMEIIGGEIRHYREQAGLSLDAVSGIVYLSAGMVQKIERGVRAPTADFIRRMEESELFDTRGALQRLYDRLRRYLRSGTVPAWYLPFTERLEAARRVYSCSALILDGLLQTEGYTRAVLATRTGITPEELDAEVAERIARQQAITGGTTRSWFLLDEMILHREIGSRAVMAELCSHLIELAALPGVVIQLVPAGSGAHEGLRGPFVLLDMPDGSVTAYEDAASAGHMVDDADAVSDLRDIWEALLTTTLTASESIRRIRQLEEEWQHERVAEVKL
jgi:transcriptional regulator with XRE-family HTH domain